MRIYNTTMSDIEGVAKCHINSFPTSVSSKMGLQFCRKMMEWFVVSERGLLFHIVDSNKKIVGYVSLLRTDSKNLPGSFTCITQYAFKTIIWSLLRRPWLLMSPVFREKSVVIHSINKYVFKKKPKTKSVEEDKKFLPRIGIVGIGVMPEFQGKGYGSALIHQAKNYALNSRYGQLSLSVRRENLKAIKSYKRNGFVEVELKGKKEEIGMEVTLK